MTHNDLDRQWRQAVKRDDARWAAQEARARAALERNKLRIEAAGPRGTPADGRRHRLSPDPTTKGVRRT